MNVRRITVRSLLTGCVLGAAILPLACASPSSCVGNAISESSEAKGDEKALYGTLLDTGNIFRNGDVYEISTRNLYSFKCLTLLLMDEWKHVTPNEDSLSDWLCIPPFRVYSLLLVNSEDVTHIQTITDLRWKVKIETEADAAQFAELIGSPETGFLFADSCWRELYPQGRSSWGFYELSDAEFEEFGLPRRTITPTCGGFLIRRALYDEGSVQRQNRIIISSEYISHDGFYLLGIETEVAEGDKCPSVVHLDPDDLYSMYSDDKRVYSIIGWQEREGGAPVINRSRNSP